MANNVPSSTESQTDNRSLLNSIQATLDDLVVTGQGSQIQLCHSINTSCWLTSLF
jgi:hypothetical protein